MATRAEISVATFTGRLTDFTDEQQHFKTDFAWWVEHLDKLSKLLEAKLKEMEEAEARRTRDAEDFRTWAVTKINQIGRIFRR